MAEKNETIENAKTNVVAKKTKSTTKKVATGNTKKVVQKRASSVAGKGTTKKTGTNRTATKTAMPEKEAAKNKTKTTKKTSTAKKENTAQKESKEATTKKNVRSTSKKVVEKENEKKNTKNSKSEKLLEKETKNNEELLEAEVEESEKENKEENNKQLQKKSKEEIEEVVAKEIKLNKKLPASEFNKINLRVFQNVMLAVAIMFYLNLVTLGFMNIENPVFITDLKVFSITLLAISIIVFEYAYKKDSGRHTIHGVEILMLAFATMAFIYVNLMCADKFVYIVGFITYAFAIYYVAKSIIVYNRMKKEYFVNEMKEIIKK